MSGDSRPWSKHIAGVAEAMRVYARQAKLGLDAEYQAAELKVRAQRRTGELLAETGELGERARLDARRVQPVPAARCSTRAGVRAVRRGGDLLPASSAGWGRVRGGEARFGSTRRFGAPRPSS